MTVTAEYFRRDSDKRAALRDCIDNNPILMEALACVTEVSTESLPLGVSPTDIARALGEMQERLRLVPKLLELTTPLQPEQPRPPENFGTPYTADQFDEVLTP